MEMADTIAITKADGSNIIASDLACAEYRNVLHLFPPTASGWQPKVLSVSAREKRGIEDLLNIFNEFFSLVHTNGYFDRQRMDQSRHWMYTTIQEKLLEDFYHDPRISHRLKEIERKVMGGEITSYQGAAKLITEYRKGR